MKNCRYTIICGDKFYNDNFFTLRMFESVLADNVVFIDKQMDTEKLFYGYLGLDTDWLYIDSTKEIYPDIEYHLMWDKVKKTVLDSYDEEFERNLLTRYLEYATT